MSRRRVSWIEQIVTIENKGAAAQRSGLPRSSNPYNGGYNRGGGLQLQRRFAWYRGWDLAWRESRA